MRHCYLRLAGASVAAALVSFSGTAVAAEEPSGVVVVRGGVPAHISLPPVGYVLDPSDARAPIYVVNQGPGYGLAVVTYAVPTYSEGGYAYALPYPYVHGYGPSMHRRNVFRPYAGAYRYRPMPGARVIHVREEAANTPSAQPPVSESPR
jgi:hypothetical protein